MFPASARQQGVGDHLLQSFEAPQPNRRGRMAGGDSGCNFNVFIFHSLQLAVAETDGNTPVILPDANPSYEAPQDERFLQTWLKTPHQACSTSPGIIAQSSLHHSLGTAKMHLSKRSQSKVGRRYTRLSVSKSEGQTAGRAI